MPNGIIPSSKYSASFGVEIGALRILLNNNLSNSSSFCISVFVTPYQTSALYRIPFMNRDSLNNRAISI